MRFGLFEADLQSRELRKAGRQLRVQEQPFAVLAALIGRPGTIVTREELRAELWPADTFVDFDHSLNTAVNKLREVLGDSATEPQFIETVARRGYRFVAELQKHAVASAAPAVLIGQIAAATNTIRVGSGAVQLSHTTAAAVVESFGMLDAFYPGRIDLGLGRSAQRRISKPKGPRPPRPEPTREWREVDGVVIPPPFDLRGLLGSGRVKASMSVLQQPEAVAPDFEEQLGDIIAMLAGTYEVDGFDLHAVPGEGAALTPWIFGSSKGRSAKVAGALGLPFVASYHITPATALDAIDAYRDAFVPSAALARPYVVVSADIVVADDSATATHLASSYGQWVYSIRAGGGAIPYPDPDHCPPLTDDQLAVVKDRIATQFVGNPDEVAERLHTLQRATDADELVITSVTHRHTDRLRSHELIAKRWGLAE